MSSIGGVFAVALLAGLSYWIADRASLSHVLLVAWKGSAVVLLAIWAALNADRRDGWWFAGVLALGALGDMLLEYSQTAGAIAFLTGHAAAAGLYLRYRRAVPTFPQRALAVVLLVAVPLISFWLPADRAGAPGVAVYALFLGAMASTAWASRFPRYRVGLGAILFVASDLMIFARMGPLMQSPLPHLLIWPLYLAGQALIAWGVVTALARWRNDDDLHHRL